VHQRQTPTGQLNLQLPGPFALVAALVADREGQVATVGGQLVALELLWRVEEILVTGWEVGEAHAVLLVDHVGHVSDKHASVVALVVHGPALGVTNREMEIVGYMLKIS